MTNVKTGRSASGRYIEFAMATMARDEKVRITLVETPRWFNGQTIRIQKVNARGYIFPGPEFPASQVLMLLGAMATLLTEEEKAVA